MSWHNMVSGRIRTYGYVTVEHVQYFMGGTWAEAKKYINKRVKKKTLVEKGVGKYYNPQVQAKPSVRKEIKPIIDFYEFNQQGPHRCDAPCSDETKAIGACMCQVMNSARKNDIQGTKVLIEPEPHPLKNVPIHYPMSEMKGFH